MDNSSLSSQGLTARRDPEKKVCYVSKLDSSFPSPGQMKQEMEQVRLVEKFNLIRNIIKLPTDMAAVKWQKYLSLSSAINKRELLLLYS